MSPAGPGLSLMVMAQSNDGVEITLHQSLRSVASAVARATALDASTQM
jgi:hypothetical protein